MARLLILNNEYPADRTHGQHLRIHALCRELLRTHDCYFISFSEKGSESSGHEDLPFTEEVYLSPPEKKNRSLMRHFRLSSARYLEQSSPDYFRRTVADVRKLASQWDVEVLVNFSSRFSEIGKEIDLPRILDYPDSGTLSIERALAHRGREMGMKNRLLRKLQLIRQSARDRELLGKYDLVTTIAEPDRKRMLEVSGLTRDRVIVIPNGVGADFLQQPTMPIERSRSIVFWGNLDFPPNWSAIRHFYTSIFIPFLAEKGIEWHIIGKGSDGRLGEVAAHPLVHMAGFQPDLVSYVADKGVMINPMIEGGGLKNKVLESFAMNVPIVSSAMGIEAIDGVDGEHYLVADTPEDFSNCVLRLLDDKKLANSMTESANRCVREFYTWQVVGRRFADVIQPLL
jgi:glycosyltransferase involved in cell wall biosynthesis